MNHVRFMKRRKKGKYLYKCLNPAHGEEGYSWRSNLPTETPPRQCSSCHNTHWGDAPYWTEKAMADRNVQFLKNRSKNKRAQGKNSKKNGMEMIFEGESAKFKADRTTKIRECLRCEKPFTSEGIHNRVCDPCDRINSGSSGITEHAMI